MTISGPPAKQWEQVVVEHSTRVYRYALRLTGNRSDAEDLTQEVIVRAFRSYATFRPDSPDSLSAWLHRITRNLFLDQVRRRARLRFDAVDEANLRLPPVPAPDDLLVDGLFEPDVQSALAGIAPEFRSAVMLYDVQGLSYREIADLQGVKLGTVRSRIHRGRALLRKALAHRAPGSGRLRYSGPPSWATMAG